MSEYQYYEFAALDGPISDDGMRYAEGCSSRAEVTRFRWRNVYNWGDFHGSVKKLLKYYDAHFYLTNWGTVQFALAFPEGCLDRGAVEAYLRDDDEFGSSLVLDKIDSRDVLWWNRHEDGGGEWEEGEGTLGPLTGIREELMRGDFRSLFLGWLAGFWPEDRLENGEEDNADGDLFVPPVPSGLDCLTAAQSALIAEFPVDPDVLAAAAGQSTGAMPERIPISAILEDLSTAEMRALLQRVAEGDGARVMSELNRLTYPKLESPSGTGMSCRDLAAKSRVARKARLRREAKEKAVRDARAAAERKRHLESVIKRAESIWVGLDSVMERKVASVYDAVARQLVELRDAYAQAGKDGEFQFRLGDFRDRYCRRLAMLKRISEL